MKVLTLQRCVDCDYVANFSRMGCPRCLSNLEDFEAEGVGVVMTFSIVHSWVECFEDYLPIVFAVIKLVEGVEVVSSIVGEDRLQITVGDSVVLAESGWSTRPQFRLSG